MDLKVRAYVDWLPFEDRVQRYLARCFGVTSWGLLTSKSGSRRRRNSRVWMARKALAEKDEKYELAVELARFEEGLRDHLFQTLRESPKVPFTKAGIEMTSRKIEEVMKSFDESQRISIRHQEAI